MVKKQKPSMHACNIDLSRYVMFIDLDLYRNVDRFVADRRTGKSIVALSLRVSLTAVYLGLLTVRLV